MANAITGLAAPVHRVKDTGECLTVTARTSQTGALIRAADGYEVDVDVGEVCIAVNRFPPGQFFDVLAELADRLRASVPDGPVTAMTLP
ncbi:hypothetical protein ACFV8T_34945 [Streptomyces sp. NPDC059832]|uniref:hypothetical protein n=1 Tax=unclassified Streptomyces TaxID=2593676 RepID=UPI00364F93DD